MRKLRQKKRHRITLNGEVISRGCYCVALFEPLKLAFTDPLNFLFEGVGKTYRGGAGALEFIRLKEKSFGRELKGDLVLANLQGEIDSFTA